MARKISFSERFPLAGIFLVIAVAIAIPLTIWSLNNVSTQTQQFAAQGGNGKGHNKNVTPTPTPPKGCYYTTTCPEIACRQGQPCPTCTPTLFCPPTPTPTAVPIVTPTPPSSGITCASLGGTCYYNYTTVFACPIGTSIVQSTTPLCGTSGTNTYNGVCCK